MRRPIPFFPAPVHRTRGLTMIELVMMLTIISVLAAIGVPRYGRSLALDRAQAAAARLAGDINFARTRARTSSLGQSIVFDPATSSYTLPGVTGLSELVSPYKVWLTKDPYAATLLTANFSASTTLSFDRFGQPSAGGTVTLQSGTMTAGVIVDAATGLASVQ
jgi:Tfp pilus assembly protein FimT